MRFSYSLESLKDPLTSADSLDFGSCDHGRAASVGVQTWFATCVGPFKTYWLNDAETVEEVLYKLTSSIRPTVV